MYYVPTTRDIIVKVCDETLRGSHPRVKIIVKMFRR
jgi:hypothetical protein